MLEYNKTTQVVIELVKQLFKLNIGDKMCSVREYVKMLDTSQGTVQNALNYLIEHNAIAIDKRGSKGSFLTHFDMQVILQILGKQHLIGCMPLPYSKRYEGLATGLSELTREDMRFHLMYMRGSKNRISRLLEGNVDYAIISYSAALKAIEEGQRIEVAKTIGKYTFVSKHILVLSRMFKGDLDSNTVLGVDETSSDQLEIAKILQETINVKLKYFNASLMRKYLDSGEIDATIWNYDEIKEKELDYDYKDLAFLSGLTEYTEAAIIIKENDYITKRIIFDVIHEERILEIQNGVIDGTITPVY